MVSQAERALRVREADVRLGEARLAATTARGSIGLVQASVGVITALLFYLMFGGAAFVVLGKLISSIPLPLMVGIVLTALVVWRGR